MEKIPKLMNFCLFLAFIISISNFLLAIDLKLTFIEHSVGILPKMSHLNFHAKTKL